jgi:hypothetical protein
MKWTAAVLGMTSLALFACPATAQPPNRPNNLLPAGWYLDYNTAKAQAKKTGKPMLVMFH